MKQSLLFAKTKTTIQTGPVVCAYGGGRNSTALVVEYARRNLRLDLILFADTGAEKPETYAFLWQFALWCQEHLPNTFLVIVKNDGIYGDLETELLTLKALPSKVYGSPSCSDKYKRRPQNKFLSIWPPAIAAWARGEQVQFLIGIHAEEAHRAAQAAEEKKYCYQFPLIDWNWGQEECEAAILAADLPLPPKSACYFCPSSKKAEILRLAQEHPELLARAVAIEENSRENWESIKGLGRQWSWKDLVQTDEKKRQQYKENMSQNCMCIDD